MLENIFGMPFFYCHFFNQTTIIMFNTHIGIHVLRGYEICVTVQEYLLTV